MKKRLLFTIAFIGFASNAQASQDQCSASFDVQRPTVVSAPLAPVAIVGAPAVAQPATPTQPAAQPTAPAPVAQPAAQGVNQASNQTATQSNTKTAETAAQTERSSRVRRNIGPQPKDLDSLIQQVAVRDTILSELQQIEWYETSIARWRKWSGSYERTSVENANQKRRNIDGFLRRGQVSKATDEWRKLFRDVELSYFTILDLERQMEQARTLPATSRDAENLRAHLISDLEAKYAEHIQIFGTSYGEYVAARMYLEDIIKRKTYADLGRSSRQDARLQTSIAQALPGMSHTDLLAKYVESAEDLYENLGASNIDKMFPGLNITDYRVELQDIKTMFQKRPKALLAKLQRDRKEQRWTFAKTFTLAEPMLKMLEGTINLLPKGASHRVRDFLGLARGLRARRRYLAKVDAILSMPNDPASQLNELRSLNAPTQDEFLTFFVQHVEGTETWLSMKAEAKRRAQDPENRIHADFYKRMVQAEDRGIGSEISPNYSPNPADVGAALLAAGATTYFGMNLEGLFAIGQTLVSSAANMSAVELGLAGTGLTGAALYVKGKWDKVKERRRALEKQVEEAQAQAAKEAQAAQAAQDTKDGTQAVPVKQTGT